MKTREEYFRPKTLCEVAEGSGALEEFGRNLRDWQHEIQRGGVHSRKEFASRMADAPPLLAPRFEQGDVADAMLAAYAEWLADQASVPRPEWCRDRNRVSQTPWFGTPLRGWVLAHAPASFRQRNLFTIPESVFTPRRGRPRVSREQKAGKAAERQRAYRKRIRKLLEEARSRDHRNG